MSPQEQMDKIQGQFRVRALKVEYLKIKGISRPTNSYPKVNLKLLSVRKIPQFETKITLIKGLVVIRKV